MSVNLRQTTHEKEKEEQRTPSRNSFDSVHSTSFNTGESNRTNPSLSTTYQLPSILLFIKQQEDQSKYYIIVIGIVIGIVTGTVIVTGIVTGTVIGTAIAV